jgi:hypothetical protein
MQYVSSFYLFFLIKDLEYFIQNIFLPHLIGSSPIASILLVHETGLTLVLDDCEAITAIIIYL